MTDETTSEQLAEIEGQGESTPVTEYTPPEGWRLLQTGETLTLGDIWVRPNDDAMFQTVHVGSVVGVNRRYIRQIDQQHMKIAELERQVEAVKTQELPDKTQELPEYTPPEGWRVVRFGEQLLPGDVWVSQDGTEQRSDILHWDASAVSGGRCIRRIESEPQQVNDWPSVRDLRHELKTVQTQLGESRQRVTQLEELVTSLRTINEAQEKAFEAAGQHNSDLQSRLNAVCAEWVQQAETIRRLLIELDAAQQVPADSPELRQLRADLEQVTQERDQYLDSYQRIFGDLETIRETTKAATVEAIAEWLEPIRAIDHLNLSNETLQHLPQIMRHLVGLDSHAID